MKATNDNLLESSAPNENEPRVHLHLVLPPEKAIDFVLFVYEAIEMKQAYWGSSILPHYLEELKKLAVTLNLQLGPYQQKQMQEARFKSDYALSPAMKKVFAKIPVTVALPDANKWIVFDYSSHEGSGFNALGIIRGKDVLTQAGMPYCQIEHLTQWRYAHIQEV
jgi:hypothetical protein